jgi:ATP-binding cassette subfamily B protein
MTSAEDRDQETPPPDESSSRRRNRSPLAIARDTRHAWRRTSPFIGASRWRLLALASASVAGGITEALLLTLIAALAHALALGETVITPGVGSSELEIGLGAVFAACLAAAVLRGVLQVLITYLPATMSANANVAIRRNLFDAFTRTTWAIQSSERDGHFQSLINLHVSRACAAMIALGTAISSTVMLLTLLVAAFLLSAVAAIAILTVSVGLFILLRPLARHLRRYASALSAENLEFSQAAQEIVALAEETQVFGASDQYRQTFYSRLDRVRTPLLRTRFLAKGLPALYQSLALLLLVVALFAIYVRGGAAIASLGAVVLLLIRSLSYGQQMQASTANLDELVPFMYRLSDAMDLYRANAREGGERPVPGIERLGLEDVSFSYKPDVPVLQGITFEAKLGEALGIVGPSGAGKSSLVQLLLRLRAPQTGKVSVNGTDAREFDIASWQHEVTYVPQSPQLFYGTVADNIKFFRPHLTHEQVVSAAKKAHVHDDIMSWPQGYDTVVGQRVSAVSGGQRQRICLARALADGPSVLILDEPTSALDVKSEMLIQESLQELKGEVILFLVAHRLSTLAVCDRVMVVVRGQVDAIGKHDSLSLSNTFYREVTEITHRQARA